MVEEPGLEWLTADRGAEKSGERVAPPCRVPLDPKGRVSRGFTTGRRRLGNEQAHRMSSPPERPRISANWSASI